MCPGLQDWWFIFLPPTSFPFAGTAAAALFLSLLAAEVVNSFPYGPLPWPKWFRKYVFRLFGLTEKQAVAESTRKADRESRADTTELAPADEVQQDRLENWNNRWNRNQNLALALATAIELHGDALDRLFSKRRRRCSQSQSLLELGRCMSV